MKKTAAQAEKSAILEHYYTTLISGIMAGVIVYLAVTLRDTPYRSYAEAFFIHLIVILVIVGMGVFGAWTVMKFYHGSKYKT